MEPIWKINIKSKDKFKLIKFVFDNHLDISCGGPIKLDNEEYEIEAYVKEEKKNILFDNKYDFIEIEVVEDLIKKGIELQKDISKQNRFKNKNISELQGFGIKE